MILKAQVGNLIKRVLVSFDQPHWFDLPKWHFTTTFLYDNTRDVNTFTAERLGGSFQLEQRVSRANRVFYAFSYRQDKVDPSSFPAGFSQDLLNTYAVPVRIGMPGLPSSGIRVTIRSIQPKGLHHSRFWRSDRGLRLGGKLRACARAELNLSSFGE